MYTSSGEGKAHMILSRHHSFKNEYKIFRLLIEIIKSLHNYTNESWMHMNLNNSYLDRLAEQRIDSNTDDQT